MEGGSGEGEVGRLKQSQYGGWEMGRGAWENPGKKGWGSCGQERGKTQWSMRAVAVGGA